MAASPGWQRALLGAIGAPVTPNNVRFLNAWQRAEGGGARYNPLNTTQEWQGASNYNSVGVKHYPSFSAGIRATAKTLLNGRYDSIIKGLRAGTTDPMALARAEASTPWGTGALIEKVLGGPVSSSAGPVPTATPARTEAPGFGPGVGPDMLAQGAAPGPTPQQQQAQIRQAAMGSLHDIATGTKPTEAFGDVAGLIHTLRQASPQFLAQTPGGDYQPVTQATAATPLDAQAVALAKKYLGINYAWGGTSPKTGFDCSGLVQTIWKQLGVDIPRTTYAQFGAGTPVARKDLRPGDAVFFTGSDPQGGKPGHEGLYIGGGRFIEAPHSGSVVHISNLAGRSDFVGGRRFS